MDKCEIIERLKNIAEHAVYTVGEEPFVMSLDDGIAVYEAVELLKKPEINRSEFPNNWIPCSERLPEKEGWYITTVESEKTGKRRIENDLFAVDIALAHGHTPNKFCKDGYRQRTVAWMPFPEPYQEGEQDE